jgi:phage-related minor tail protein
MDEKLVIQITAEIADLKSQVAEAKAEVERLANDTKSSANEIDENFKNAGASIKSGMAIAATAVAGVITALVALGPATEEYRRNQALLTSAFESAGSSADVAKNVYNDLYRVLGDGGQATEAAQHLGKLTQEEQALSEWTNICQGVYAQFGESLPLEGLTEAVNHTAKLGEVQGPLADALEWSGITTDEFNKKLAECNTESEREKLIRETLNGMYSESAAAYEQNAASILAANEAQAKLDAALAATGEALAPVMTALKELGADVLTALQPYIQDFAENYLPTIRDVLGEVGGKISESLEWMREHKEILAVMAGLITAVVAAIGLYNAVAAVKAAMDAAQVASLGALIAAQLSQAAATMVALAPYLLIVAAIAAVIAIIVVCVKHWDDIKAAVEKAWETIKKKTTEAVEKVVKKFEEMKTNASKKIEEAKKAVSDKFEEIKKAISEKVENAKTAVVEKFEAIKTGVSEKVENVKQNISDKFELIKTTIQDKIQAAKDKVSSVFDNIKTTIKDKIDAAKDAVKSAIDKIKGFFDFEFKWPKIKLPKFSISPSGWKVGDLLKGDIPKLSIKWNAKGGVFDKPTLFGYGNSLQGIGEDGAEAVVPLEKNTEWLDKIAEKLAAKQGGSGPIVLQIDGKTLGQITCDEINKLTRQRGSIPLKIV